VNGDPYARTSQSSDRRVINRSGAGASRTPEEPSNFRDEPPHTSSRASAARRSTVENDSGKNRGSKKGILWTIVVALLILVVAGVAWFIWSSAKNTVTGIDSSRYQAVFMSGGQVYFGKLSAFNDESFKITNVYYLNTQTATDEEASDAGQQNPIHLVPITSEIHGTEDEMIIMKSQILYYENLKADSKAAQLIEQDKR